MKHRVIAGATPWRDRPFLTLQDAAEIVGCSTATLYGAAAAERLELCRLGGRTLVKTPSLVAYIATETGDGGQEESGRRWLAELSFAMARGERHYSAGPFVKPPAKSELKRLVDALEKSAAESDLPATIEDCVIEWAEDLILRRLVDKGMPAELASDPPAWLSGLVDSEATLLRAEAREQREKKRARRGRPPYPNNFANSVAIFEWHRQRSAAAQDASANAVFERVAKALGPGITRHHVRRIYKFHARRFARLKRDAPQKLELVLDMMRVIDEQAEQFRFQGARNCGGSARF